MIPLQVEEFIVPLQSKPRCACNPAGPYTLRSSLTRAAGALPAALLPYPPKALHAAKQLYPRRRRFTRRRPCPPAGPYTLRSSLTRAAGALPAAPLLLNGLQAL